MEIRVLGAFEVTEHGVSIVPTAPKPRQVLSMLALHADQVVPVDLLMGELWGECLPSSARTTLQTYILQLRELISTALDQTGDSRNAKDVLSRKSSGYILNMGGGTLDTREFERRAGVGYRAMDAEDYPAAARRLRDALSLWQGSAFADVQTGPHLTVEVARFEESRLCALDQRIEAELRLGRHRELLGELTVLTSRYRTHEALHGQLMTALHRSGRRSEALDVYRKLRDTLVRELGLEPSAGLRRLQHSILTAAQENARDDSGNENRKLAAQSG